MDKRRELRFQIELNERDVPSKNNPDSPYGGGGSTPLLVSPQVFSALGTTNFTTSELLEYLNITEEQLTDLMSAKYSHIKALVDDLVLQSPLTTLGNAVAFMVYDSSNGAYGTLTIAQSGEDEWTLKSPFVAEA